MRISKYLLILSFFSVWIFCVDVMAKHSEESDINVFIELSKEVSDSEELYGIETGIYGESLQDIKKVKITSPTKSKKIQLKSKLAFDTTVFEAEDMSFEEFETEFPEGTYKYAFSPRGKFGKTKVDIAYDFPVTPVIVFPTEADSPVPTSFTVEWNAIVSENVDALRLELESDEENGDSESFSLEIELSVNDTSFTVPEGLLQSESDYELTLETVNQDDNNNVSYVTATVVNITTGTE